MYLPRHFEQAERAALHALMREHPLAWLVTAGPHGPGADPVPLELDPDAGEHGTLNGHVARANPVWQQAAGTPVIALFSGPQAYVSPNGYASKALTHKVVPTWNYAVVQAHGPLQVVDDAAWLHALVRRLTAHHEAGSEHPWSVDDAPADYVQQMLRAIVGIQIPITRLVGKFKLGQNRSVADQQGVATALSQGPAAAQAVAALMRTRF